MGPRCRLCNVEMDPATNRKVTGEMCDQCLAAHQGNIAELIAKIREPVLLLEPDPRQVVTANESARELFGKERMQIDGHRGGEVFDCIHSFTEAGCGKDANCENCRIKGAIVDTFSTGSAVAGRSAQLDVIKSEGKMTYNIQVTTEKVGAFALVRIDTYRKEKQIP